MKLFFHYCPADFSNCYILGTDIPTEDEAAKGRMNSPEASRPGGEQPAREALIIDPGNIDPNILYIIEDNNYTLCGVLITHDHAHHVQGLRTIMKIYDTKIYAVNPVIREHRTTLIRDGELINIGPFRIEVISIPGHSADSAVYKTDGLLFTGDTLSAGLIGSTASSFAAATQVTALRSKILSLPGDYTVLPGHGPPTSLEAERRFNFSMNLFEQQKNRRPVYKIE